MLRRILILASLLICVASCALPARAQAPAATFAQTNGSGQVTVDWSAVSAATGYDLYYGTASGGPYSVHANASPITGTTFTVTGLTDNQFYYFAVCAIVSGTDSGYSPQCVARSGTAQNPAPTGLTAVASTGQVVLTWNAVSGPDQYAIFRQPLATPNAAYLYVSPLNVNPSNSTDTYTDTSVTNGTAYQYAVAAEGGVMSGWVAATPLAPPSLTATVEASANQSSSTEIDLGWTASAGATSYTVLRGTTSGGEVSIASGSNTAYSDTGLSTNTTYYYEIKAVAGSSSATSSEVSAKTGSALLAAPALSGTASDGQASLSWTAVSGASYYDLYRTPNADRTGFYTRISSGTAYMDTSVTDGTAYTYQLAAGSSNGQGNFSNTLTLTPLASPTLTASATSSSTASLSWTSITGATGYTLKRSTSSSGPWSALYSGTGTSYSDTGLTAATDYYYQVDATASGSDSGPSDVALAETFPNAPTGLTASVSAGVPQVVLSWTAPSGQVGGYRISRGTAAGQETPIQSSTVASYTDTTVTNGVTYYYKVAATDFGGVGALSNEASATATLGAPTGLTATASNGLVNLSWTAPPGTVTSYSLYRGTTSGEESGTPLQTGITGTSCADLGLTNGTTYYYTVKAVNGGGAGPQSSEASATPTNTGPSTTTQVFVVQGDGHILLAWTPVSGASSYNLYRSVAGGAVTRIQQNITTTTDFAGAGPVAYDNTVSDGVSLTYYVTAVGSSEGAPSFAIQAKANPAPSVSPIPYLSTDAGSTGSVYVALNLPIGYSQNPYFVDLYRSTTSGQETTSLPVASLQGGSGIVTSPSDGRNSVKDSGLTSGIPYYYVAAPVVASSIPSPIAYFTEGPPSSEVSFTPGAAVPSAPQSPGLTYGNFSATLTWSAPTSGTVAYYNVYENATTNSNGGPETVVVGQTTGTTFTLTGLSYNRGIYPYATSTFVAAVAATGEGPVSSTLNINLPGFGLQPVPASITLARGQHGSVTIDNPAANNFAGPLTLSVSGMPTGVTAWPDPANPLVVLSDALGNGTGGGTYPPNYSQGSNLFLSVGSNATPGTYTLTLTGTAGAVTNYPSGFTQTVTVTLTVI